MSEPFVQETVGFDTLEETEKRFGELIDWVKKLHFDSRLEGLVVMAIEREPGGTRASVRSVLVFEQAIPHLETLKEWSKRADAFYSLANTTGGNA